MNLSRNAVRIWLLASSIWVVCICGLAAQRVQNAIQEKYRYLAAAGDNPPSQLDWNERLYDLHKPPGAAEPLILASIGGRYFVKSDEHVTGGKETRTSFPDGSRLYLDANLSRLDRERLTREFWEQRWPRWWSVSWKWVARALVPPLLLLALASSFLWAIRGFRP
jgi:hypothetical protein